MFAKGRKRTYTELSHLGRSRTAALGRNRTFVLGDRSHFGFDWLVQISDVQTMSKRAVMSSRQSWLGCGNRLHQSGEPMIAGTQPEPGTVTPGATLNPN